MKAKIYGFDFDATIAQVPDIVLFNDLFHRLLWFFCRFKIVWLIYHFFRRKEIIAVTQFISYAKQHGKQIVIISANLSWRKYYLERWLRKRNIPFDKIVLPPVNLFVCQRDVRLWKKEKVIKEGCSLYVEDNLEIVEYLQKHTNCQIVHYQGQNFFELLRSEKKQI
ncbi:MAG: hypothetical protein KAS12_02475 [Candidatus Aenigmarchaeota archaeon]|nr:hypothetical protein [Candidatus Aenigmarchaeota archaeon]